MTLQSLFDHLRLVLYFILTIIVLLVSFFPEGWLCYHYLTTEPDVFQCLIAPLYLFLTYCGSVLFFGVVHSQIVVRFTLPFALKPGLYSHHSSEGRLVAIRLTADGIFKSMLKVFTFLPFFYEAFLFPYLMRLYGLKCGKNVRIGKRTWIDCPLVEIGDNTEIGYNTIIGGHVNEARKVIINPTKIGKNCTLGPYCIIAPGVEIGDNSVLESVSGFIKGQKVPPNGVWSGQPAQLLRSRSESEEHQME